MSPVLLTAAWNANSRCGPKAWGGPSARRRLRVAAGIHRWKAAARAVRRDAQRVALARALARTPTCAMDAAVRGALDVMTSLTTSSTAFCACRSDHHPRDRHNVREAVRLGDRVVALSSRRGRVIDDSRCPSKHPAADRLGPGRRTGQADHRPAAGGDEPRRPLTTGPRAGPTREAAWLEAQEVAQPDEQRSRRLAVKAWNALWPKLLAIAIGVGVWELIHVERLEEADLPRAGPPWTLGPAQPRSSGTPSPPPRARCHRVRARSGDRRGHRRPGFANPRDGRGRLADHRVAEYGR